MGTLLGCEAARVSVLVLSPLLLLTVVGGGGCGGVVCQLHSGREHLVSNLQIVAKRNFVFVLSLCVHFYVCFVEVFKGARWMPGHKKPMKDVGVCVKPRGGDNRPVSRGCPNGETCQALWSGTCR